MDDKKLRDMEGRPLRYIDTGKVKIGIYHQRKMEPDMSSDMEHVQRVMLPKPIAPLHSWPSLREIIRFWIC